MNLAERVLSGRSASCSIAFRTHRALRGCKEASAHPSSLLCRRSNRHAAAVAAAAKPSPSSKKMSRAQGKKGQPVEPSKGAKGKPLRQPSAQVLKSRKRPSDACTSSGTSSGILGDESLKQASVISPQSLPSAADNITRSARLPSRAITTATGAAAAALTAAEWATAAAAEAAAPAACAEGAVQVAALPTVADAAGLAAMIYVAGNTPVAVKATTTVLTAPTARGGAPADRALTAASPEAGSGEDGDDSEDEGFPSREGEGSDGGSEMRGGKVDEADEEGEDAFPEIRLSLPPPTKVKVKVAEYLQSCVSVSKCPVPRYPEFAVIGRSNVGKSSLINMLTGRKDLAQVSKEPGKTKCINHFLINQSWYLVDLPGYGFAKVGLSGRRQFESFTREYFKTRPNLAMVLLLVDASIPPQAIDLDYANWLTDNEVPFTLVFTKADKRRKGLTSAVRDSHVTAFQRELLRDLAYLPPSILTSSAKGMGRGELLSFIASLRVAYEKSGRLEAIRQGVL